MTTPLPVFSYALASTADVASFASPDVLLLLVFVGIALVISFTCSILEAALLSIRETELEDRAAKFDASAEKLLAIKKDRLDDAISAILILNTIAHTAGVAGAGLQAGKIWPESPVVLSVVFPSVLTLLILVGTEIIPKTLGAVHATRLVGFVAWLLGLMIIIMAPFLFLTRMVTGVLASHERKPVSRGELAAMVSIAASQGTLAQQDSRLVSNALSFHKIRVKDVMTPRTVVAMIAHDATIQDFLEDESSIQYSRVPVYGENRDDVVGFVVRRDVLAAAAKGLSTATSLEEFCRDIQFIEEDVPVSDAMRKLIQQREHLAIVTDRYGGVGGLLTLEDLMETLLGVEIVDETDKVPDLRKEAIALREKRLASRQLTKAQPSTAEPAKPKP